MLSGIWIGPPAPDTAPANERAQQVRRSIARLQAQELDLAPTRLQIRELSLTYFQSECCGHGDEQLVGSSDLARELRDFSRLEPADRGTEAQEFFYALQGCGM